MGAFLGAVTARKQSRKAGAPERRVGRAQELLVVVVDAEHFLILPFHSSKFFQFLESVFVVQFRNLPGCFRNGLGFLLLESVNFRLVRNLIQTLQLLPASPPTPPGASPLQWPSPHSGSSHRG